MESSTQILRRMLDERGVEHESTEWIDGVTVSWQDGDGTAFCARESLSLGGPTGTLDVYRLTPEQAIDATLGRGTCHETVIDHYWRGCGSCGYIWEFMYGIGKCERPHWCPNCGRRVIGGVDAN